MGKKNVLATIVVDKRHAKMVWHIFLVDTLKKTEGIDNTVYQ